MAPVQGCSPNRRQRPTVLCDSEIPKENLAFQLTELAHHLEDYSQQIHNSNRENKKLDGHCGFLELLPLELRRNVYSEIIQLPHRITLSSKQIHQLCNQSILTPLARTCKQIKAELRHWLLKKSREVALQEGIINPSTSPFGPFNRNTTTFIVQIGDLRSLIYLPGHNNERLMRLITTMRSLKNVQGENKWWIGRNGTQNIVREEIKWYLKGEHEPSANSEE